jgi:hypothetical protein
MGSWGKADFKELIGFQDKLDKMSNIDVEKFCQAAAKELAARLLAKVIKRTPVGKYPASAGKKGGTLRRGWTAQSEAEAISGGRGDPIAFVNSLHVAHENGFYIIEIVNPVTYASYVEYGHRTRDHQGWVEGRFMLTISEQELDSQSVSILENKLNKFLGGVFQ